METTDTTTSTNNSSSSLLQYKEASTWDEMDLHTNLLKGIYAYGFETPSDIQKKAIPAFLTKRDIIAQAQSGMGKTGTFTIGILQQIDVSLNTTQAIVIAHTHELAKQITQVFQALGCNIPGLRVKTLVGGSSVSEDIQDLKTTPPHVVIGCTGRIYDMMYRRALKTADIGILCLDEADEMLMGFKEQIYNIFQELRPNIQVALFSATMPEEVMELTNKFMRDPIQIIMKAEQLALECIAQYYVAVQDDQDKYETLKNLFSTITVSQCIIYCNSVGRVMNLYRNLIDDGFSVSCIHSNMTKMERDAIMKEFRTGSCRFLVSSNLTARGIDVQQVSTVINVDVPNCVHTYLHRIGRSGRWGRKGMAINLITRRDVRIVKEIERYYKTSILEFSPANIIMSK